MTYPRQYIAITILLLCTIACSAQAQTVAPTTAPTAEVGHMTEVSRTLTICNSGGLYFRTGAGVEYEALSVIADGQVVEYISETYSTDNAVWFVVRYGERVGYLNSRYTCE